MFFFLFRSLVGDIFKKYLPRKEENTCVILISGSKLINFLCEENLWSLCFAFLSLYLCIYIDIEIQIQIKFATFGECRKFRLQTLDREKTRSQAIWFRFFFSFHHHLYFFNRNVFLLLCKGNKKSLPELTSVK